MWVGGTELLAGISGRTGLRATPTLQYVAVRDGLLREEGNRCGVARLLRAGAVEPVLEIEDYADLDIDRGAWANPALTRPLG